jgi:delta 1-pyrroline-5-carboxylate dehydrogenase
VHKIQFTHKTLSTHTNLLIYEQGGSVLRNGLFSALSRQSSTGIQTSRIGVLVFHNPNGAICESARSIDKRRMDKRGELCTRHQPLEPEDAIAVYAQGGAADVDIAVAAATQAFPAWAASNIQVRSDALDKIGNELLARKEELGTLLSREEGKTKAEGVGEVTRAGQIFKFFAGECLRLSGQVLPSVRPGVGIEITREPVGVVGLITPGTFRWRFLHGRLHLRWPSGTVWF